MRTVRIRWAGYGMALASLASASPAQTTAGGWVLRPSTSNPGERADYMVSFFVPTAEPILFGGRSLHGGLALGGTWTFDGFDWREISTQNSPAPRSRAAMAYDPVRERIILFGGVDESAGPGGRELLYGDTWAFDGQNWTRLSPNTSPPPLVGPQMAFDPTTRKLLMYGGGEEFLASLSSDTWTFDGIDWQQLTPIENPGTLKDHRMVTDTARNRIVLFGGIDSEVRFLNQTRTNRTWEWTGDNWLSKSVVSSPRARHSFGMVYDSVRDLTVMSYGTTGLNGRTKLGDTWFWSGNGWSLDVFFDSKPRARGGVQLIQNPNTGCLILYGGDVAAPSPGDTVDTWELGCFGVADSRPFSSGCAGSAGTPSLAAVAGSRPILGQTLQLRSTNLPLSASAFAIGFLGLSRQRWRTTGLILPLDLRPLGMPSCSLLVSPDRTSKPLAISPTGQADWLLAIPNDSTLVNRDVYSQVFVFDPGANLLSVTASNAIAARVGTL